MKRSSTNNRDKNNLPDTANSLSQGGKTSAGAGESVKNPVGRQSKAKVIPTGSFDLDDEKGKYPNIDGLPPGGSGTQDITSERNYKDGGFPAPEGFSSAPHSLSHMNSGD